MFPWVADVGERAEGKGQRVEERRVESEEWRVESGETVHVSRVQRVKEKRGMRGHECVDSFRGDE